jgi:UDP-glucuronate decarboxylase
MILTIGILFGYLLLPVLLVSHLGFDDMPMPQSTLSKPPTLSRQFDSSPADSYILNHVRGQGKPEAIEVPKMMPTTRNLIPKVAMTSVEQRLVEDHNVLAKQSLPTSNTPHVMKTTMLPDHQRKKILVTGGAGFVGSHLVDKLMMEGHEVTVVDNFFTGQKKNIAHWLHHPNFRYVWESSR